VAHLVDRREGRVVTLRPHRVPNCTTPPGHRTHSDKSTDRKEYNRCLGSSRSSGSGSAYWAEHTLDASAQPTRTGHPLPRHHPPFALRDHPKADPRFRSFPSADGGGSTINQSCHISPNTVASQRLTKGATTHVSSARNRRPSPPPQRTGTRSHGRSGRRRPGVGHRDRTRSAAGLRDRP
jgi:hypothetical protein